MRTYPYSAWYLRHSFDPAKVTLVEQHNNRHESDVTADGKWYPVDSLHLTLESCIKAGIAQLTVSDDNLRRQKETNRKRRAALMKAISLMEKGAIE